MYKSKHNDGIWQRAKGFEPGKPARVYSRSGVLTVHAGAGGRRGHSGWWWGWWITDGNGVQIASSNEAGVMTPHTEEAAALCDGVNWAQAIIAAEMSGSNRASPSHSVAA